MKIVQPSYKLLLMWEVWSVPLCALHDEICESIQRKRTVNIVHKTIELVHLNYDLYHLRGIKKKKAASIPHAIFSVVGDSTTRVISAMLFTSKFRGNESKFSTRKGCKYCFTFDMKWAPLYTMDKELCVLESGILEAGW